MPIWACCVLIWGEWGSKRPKKPLLLNCPLDDGVHRRKEMVSREKHREKGNGKLLPSLSRVKLKMTPEMNIDNDVNDSIQSSVRIAFGREGNKASSVVIQRKMKSL